ncbi:MAG: hypothetical protein ACK4ND_09850 [Cytophagaceae bacterium]
MKKWALHIVTIFILAGTACNRDVAQTQHGQDLPAGRDPQTVEDHQSDPTPGLPQTGPWTGTFPEGAPGGY